MANAKSRSGTGRREAALSLPQIIDAAIAILDEEGENGLTFRALAERLTTGAGAVYWYIASKSELLEAASDAIVSDALSHLRPSGSPQASIRRLAVAIFEAVDAHAWVGAQLSRAPWQRAVLQIFERIGQQLQALGVSRRAQFTTASTLLSYIIGASSQNAVNARLLPPATDRASFLQQHSTAWQSLDAGDYPFTRSVATQLRDHDDRAEFLAGVDLFLKGVTQRLR